MTRASQPDKQYGTLSADTIRASGHVRLHQQAGHKSAPDQNAKNIESTLAMREPSTQDIRSLTARQFSASSLAGMITTDSPQPQASVWFGFTKMNFWATGSQCMRVMPIPFPS